jgi:hypothetical protein
MALWMDSQASPGGSRRLVRLVLRNRLFCAVLPHEFSRNVTLTINSRFKGIRQRRRVRASSKAASPSRRPVHSGNEINWPPHGVAVDKAGEGANTGT